MAMAIGESPIEILMKEHELLLKYAGELKTLAEEMNKHNNTNEAGDKMNELLHYVQIFKDSASHYLREENVLFPWAEKKGISGPPRVMWMEHDHIREIEKRFYSHVSEIDSMPFRKFAKELENIAVELEEMLVSHFYKENNILFPATQQVISNDEWLEIKTQFNEIGYCSFSPKPAVAPVEKKTIPASQLIKDGYVELASGHLSIPQVEAIFNTLPVDVTFIDDEDTVCFFSEGKDKIFPRTRAIIGLKVQQCHPQKSVHLVNQILDDFKKGKRDVAEFWIPLNEKFVHIRYFAVRDKSNKYLGCMEITQDIAPIKKIEGEKRLL